MHTRLWMYMNEPYATKYGYLQSDPTSIQNSYALTGFHAMKKNAYHANHR